jgi:hypothetical protein
MYLESYVITLKFLYNLYLFFSAVPYLAKYSFILLEFEYRFADRSSLFSKSFLKVPIV